MSPSPVGMVYSAEISLPWPIYDVSSEHTAAGNDPEGHGNEPGTT